MGYGWEGEKVRLVPLDRERHLANAVRWINDPEVTRWTLVGDWPLTAGGEEAWFRKADSNPRDEVHFAIESLQGEHIGFSGVMRIEWPSRAATTGSFIGRTDLWGRGYGRDAARVRTRFATEALGLRLLLAETLADNAASLGMLRSVGYREVGRIPARHFKRGALRDAVVMAWWQD